MWAAEARQRAEWDHTASLLALTANVHRDPKKGRPATPAKFHPLRGRQAERTQAKKAPIRVLKDIFVRGQPPTSKKDE